MVDFFLFLFLMLVGVLVSVTFLTLFEQKVLSYIQFRKGPNKVGFMGILQPFSDALKLFMKEVIVPSHSNFIIFYFSPIISLFLSLVIWLMLPFFFKMFSFGLSFLFMVSVMSLSVYPLMFSGWSSNSVYSLIGSLRGIAQVVSYEVCMIFLFMVCFLLVMKLNFFFFFSFQKYLNFIFINMVMSFILFIMFLAETNRSPFDFSEGESELVSGFNVEYSGGGFALFFLAEYAMILFFSLIFIYFYMLGSGVLILFILSVLVSFLFIWIRGSYPRFRYDKLMFLTWKVYLLLSLLFLFNYIIFISCL